MEETFPDSEASEIAVGFLYMTLCGTSNTLQMQLLLTCLDTFVYIMK